MLKKICLLVGFAMPFSPVIMAEDLYHTPIGEMAEFEDTDTDEIKALLAEALAENKLAAAMKEYAPDAYDQMLNSVMNGVDENQTVMEIAADFIPHMEALLMQYLPYGDDQSLLMFSDAMHPMMQLVENYPNGCQALLMGDHQVIAELSSSADTSLQDEMSDMFVRVLETYDESRPMPSEEEVMPDLMTTMMPILDEYGADFLMALESPMQVQDATPCLAMADLYANISQLPEHDAAELLRFMVSSSQ